jgi:hypothetical protein
MIFLSGFTNSALVAIAGIYLVISALVFMLVFAFLLNIKPFVLFLERNKEKSQLRYYSIILLLFILNTILVTLIIYLKYAISGKGLIE